MKKKVITSVFLLPIVSVMFCFTSCQKELIELPENNAEVEARAAFSATDVIGSASVLTESQRSKVISAINVLYSNSLFKARLERFYNSSNKINFFVDATKTSQYAVNSSYNAAFQIGTHNIYFRNESSISYSYLLEEFIHYIQYHDFYGSQMSYTSPINYTYEAYVFMDIMTNGMRIYLPTSKDQNDYAAWIYEMWNTQKFQFATDVNKYFDFLHLWAPSGSYVSLWPDPLVIESYFR